MSVIQTRFETPQAYENRLREVCPTTVMKWKVAKSALYSSFVIGILLISAFTDATWELAVVAIAAVVAIVVGEVKEIEIASLLTIRFKNGHGTEEED